MSAILFIQLPEDLQYVEFIVLDGFCEFCEEPVEDTSINDDQGGVYCSIDCYYAAYDHDYDEGDMLDAYFGDPEESKPT